MMWFGNPSTMIRKNDIIVELMDSSEIPESELSEFRETKPIKIEDLEQESQEILIKKYVNGEVSFPTYYTTFDEDDDDNRVSSQQSFKSQKSLPSSSASTTLSDSSQKKEKRVFRRKTTLNPTLQGLMGEANLSFARGQIEIAEKICLEIIRQNPLAPEPFFTLAQLYETKDPEKFLNFSTIAAHLDPSNRDQWIRIAQINIEQKNYAQARVHISKAIKHLPTDYDLRLRKADLLLNYINENDAMLTYLKSVSILPPELCLTIAKKVANYFYNSKSSKIILALEAMHSAYKKYPNLFTNDEDINLLLELLILNKNYHTILLVLRDQRNLEINFREENEKTIVIDCNLPESFIPDFRTKACVSLIHLQAFHLLPYILENFRKIIFPVMVADSDNRNKYVNWYVDIAEALMEEEKYTETIELLKPTIDAQIAPPYVWLRNAECYRSLGMIENAIKSYYEVINIAPLCSDAKFTLSALLKQQGRPREAIKVLEQDVDENAAINPRLFYERCLMLKSVGEIEQFIDVGYTLLARNSLKFRTREEIVVCANGGHQYNPDTFKNIVQSRLDDNPEPVQIDVNGNDLSIEDEFELFKNIANTAYEHGKYSKLEKLCFAILTAKRFKNTAHDMEKMLMFSSLYNNDGVVTFIFFREMLPKHLDNNALWNFMNIIIQKSDDNRYYRYLKRMFVRHLDCSPYLKILLANYHLAVGSYKYALNFYVPVLKEFKDALSALCTAVCFSQMALQKNSLKKPSCVGQAIGFINLYKKFRICPALKQEIFYNIGRLHHQCGAIHVALSYYEEALEATDSLIEENSDILGLKEEIAFNIHLIYKASGNLKMARHILFKYISV